MHPDILSSFDLLAERMKNRLEGHKAIFMINPGNWGDSLIREGAERFFRQYQIPYRKVRLKQFERGKIDIHILRKKLSAEPLLIVNGSGGYVSKYDLFGRVNNVAATFSRSIYLPSTFGFEVLDSDIPLGTTCYARDNFESRTNNPAAEFFHDMAFFLSLKEKRKGNGVGMMFRNDVEAPKKIGTPKGNVDVSGFGRTNKSINGFLKHISKFETIHTNRLHIGIGAAILGRDVHLYPNNYFKNRAIFESSIQPYFSNVTFHPNATDIPV